MATYADIYNAAIDSNYQGRCYVAAWLVAWDILGDSNAPQERKEWAGEVVQRRMAVTPEQLVMALMRNATVQAQVGAATDEQLLTAVLTGLDELVAAG